MIRFYDNVLRKVSGGLVGISCALLVALAIFTMVDVVMRYVFHSPILGDIEMVEVVMSIIVFATFAYTQCEKGHIHVTLLIERLPRKIGIMIYAINSLLVAAASVAVSIGLFQQGGYVLRKHTTSVIRHIPYYPFYYVASILMWVFTAVLIADAIINFMAVSNKEAEERVTENWQ